MSLFKVWEEAHKNKKLPKEWRTWEKFRAWAIQNRYKPEYGYKGEFSLHGCLKAMPDYVEKIKEKVIDTPENEEITHGKDEKLITNPVENEESTEKGVSNASKKTNTRTRSSNSV